jgi:type II secretion system protein N
MKERFKKYLPFVGYPIFYVVSLVLFASWTFPYEKLKDRIVLSFNAEQRKTPGAQELSIKELTSSWLTGVKMTDVRLTGAPDADGRANEIKVDQATARISLLALLIGRQTVSFHMKALGGEIEGDVTNSNKERGIDVSIDSVDFGQVGPVTQALGLPLEGKLTGTIKLSMPEGKASKANGAVNLEARDVAVGDGKAKLRGALALPRINVGALTISGDAKDGVMKFTKVSSGGKDVEIQGDGRIQLREVAAESLLDLYLRFKINDAYRSKNDITKSLFGAPGSSAPALFDLDAKVKQSKRPDGFYSWHLRGPLSKPEPEPAPNGSGGSPGTKL